MQRLTISLVVALVLTGCWAVPFGLNLDSVTSLDSLDSFESATGLESDAGGATDGSEPTSEGGTEETGVVECVPTELPEAAPGYWPKGLVSGLDGTLYVGGLIVGAEKLPGCDPVPDGGFVAGFAPDGTCTAIWSLPGGQIWDIAIQGDQIAAVGALGTSAYLAVFDGSFDKPVYNNALGDGWATAVTGLGGGRWGVAGWCQKVSGNTALYAEYTAGEKPIVLCPEVGNESQAWDVIVDGPGNTIYLAGIYTQGAALHFQPELVYDNQLWLKSMALDSEVPASQRLDEAKGRELLAGSAFRPRLALAGERIFIVTHSRSHASAFPPVEASGECAELIGWLMKADIQMDAGQGLWLNVGETQCRLQVDSMIANGDSVLIAGTTERSFVDSAEPVPAQYNKQADDIDTFVARINTQSLSAKYATVSLPGAEVAIEAHVVRRCDGEGVVVFATGPLSAPTMRFALSPL